MTARPPPARSSRPRSRRSTAWTPSFAPTASSSPSARSAEADAYDSGKDDRPLGGVPVAIKDDADVAGEITAWGTRAYGAPKAADSDVVVRLREAGAIVIGKTQVPEMTMWPWTVSAGYGSVRNPWGMDRTPGGSSGGSAAARRRACAASRSARTAAARSAIRRR